MVKEKEVTVGTVYQARSNLLRHFFQGEVVVKLTNSVILDVQTCSPTDQQSVYDLNHRLVVRYQDLMVVSDT